jgi:hypothetical protein
VFGAVIGSLLSTAVLGVLVVFVILELTLAPGCFS